MRENPFKCPASVYSAMTTPHASPLLKAVMWLGPERITWHVESPPSNGAQYSFDKTPMHWRFSGDSHHLTCNQIFAAAMKIGFQRKEAA